MESMVQWNQPGINSDRLEPPQENKRNIGEKDEHECCRRVLSKLDQLELNWIPAISNHFIAGFISITITWPFPYVLSNLEL